MPFVITLDNVDAIGDIRPVGIVLQSANGALDLAAALCRQLAEELPYGRDPRAVAPYCEELLSLARELDSIRTDGGSMPLVDHSVQLDRAGAWSLALDGPTPRLRVYPCR